MADSNSNGESRQERFVKWNPYASELLNRDAEGLERMTTDAKAILALVFEVSQLRTEIHFAAKGRSK